MGKARGTRCTTDAHCQFAEWRHIDLVKKAATKMAYFDAACPIPDLFTWASAAHDEVQCRWNKKRSEALPELLGLRIVLRLGELLLMWLACTYSELQSAKLSGNGPQHLGRNTMCVSCICAHIARQWSHSTDVKDLCLLGSNFCSFVCSLRSPWSLWRPVECVLATLDVNRHGITSQRLHGDVHAATQVQSQVQRALLLDVVVRQASPVFQRRLSLLVGMNAIFVLCRPHTLRGVPSHIALVHLYPLVLSAQRPFFFHLSSS